MGLKFNKMTKMLKIPILESYISNTARHKKLFVKPILVIIVCFFVKSTLSVENQTKNVPINFQNQFIA